MLSTLDGDDAGFEPGLSGSASGSMGKVTFISSNALLSIIYNVPGRLYNEITIQSTNSLLFAMGLSYTHCRTVSETAYPYLQSQHLSQKKTVQFQAYLCSRQHWAKGT